MKEKIKSISLIYKPYCFLRDKFRVFLLYVYPTYDSKRSYKNVFGERIDLKHPKNFNEKLMWLKLHTYYKNPLVTKCADKYLVRDYVNEKGCGDCLNELLFTFDTPDEIDWDKLPNSFALKYNHGCGYNIICSDKSHFDRKEAMLKLKKWQKEDFWKIYGELNYKYIPKKIICEKYLETSAGFLPNDYKIYCFNGKPQLVLVCTERSKKLKLEFFDLNWKLLDIGREKADKSIEKPKSFDKMLEVAEKLSEGIPFVRVDFYEFEGKPIFGEMTFTPAGCVANYYNKKGLKLLGDMLDIDDLINENRGK